MTRGSNVIPIGYVPSPHRETMMSSDTRFTHDSLSTIPPHPPTQFFSADDILRNSLATTHRDTRYSDRDTVYTARDSVRDSVGTTYTRASYSTNAYRSTAIIAAAPVPVAVRGLQPKIVTFGKRGSQTPPIPAVPQLTAEKVEAAERNLVASRTGNISSVLLTDDASKTNSTQGLGLDIPIDIQMATPRASAAVTPTTPTAPSILASPAQTEQGVSPFEDEIPESPILGKAEIDSLPNTPTLPYPPDIRITLMPDSPTTSSVFDDSKAISRPQSIQPSTEEKSSGQPRE